VSMRVEEIKYYCGTGGASASTHHCVVWHDFSLMTIYVNCGHYYWAGCDLAWRWFYFFFLYNDSGFDDGSGACGVGSRRF